jgi:hypothetical protein
MASDCGHCLRPEFTQALLKTLIEGGSVNLIGPAGSGRGRLIEDLRRCVPADRQVLHADMKSWRASHEGFIALLAWDAWGAPLLSTGSSSRREHRR